MNNDKLRRMGLYLQYFGKTFIDKADNWVIA